MEIEIQDPDGFRTGLLSNGQVINQRMFTFTSSENTSFAWRGDPTDGVICANAGAPPATTTIRVAFPDGMTGEVQLTSLAPGTSAPQVLYPAQAPLRPAGVLPTYTIASGAASALPSTQVASTPASTAPSSTSAGAGVAPLGLLAPGSTTSSPTRWVGQLVLDGETMPAALISGGSAVGTVVSNTLGGNNLPTKHIADITTEPLVIGVAPIGQVASWINSAWSAQPVTHNGQINANPAGALAQSAAGKVQFTMALVVSTRIPTLGAGTPDKYELVSLTLAPEQVRGGVTGTAAAGAGPATISGFRFKMSGVEGGAVQRIESFAVETGAPGADAVGHQFTRSTPLPPVFPNILVTITEAQAPGWLAWYNDWMYNGKHLAADEKTFTLDLLSTKSNTVVATIAGHGVGLVSLRAGELIGGKTTLQAELYVTTMEIKEVK